MENSTIPSDKSVNSLEKTDAITKNYNIFLETANDAIIIVSLDGIIVYANEASEDITGYARNELHKVEILNLELTQKIGKLLDTVKELYSAQTKDAKLNLLVKNSIVVLAKMHISECIWNDKPHIFCRIKDLSEIQSLNDHIENLFRLSPTWTLLLTHPDKKIVSLNQTFLERFNIDSSDIFGKSTRDIGFQLKNITGEKTLENLHNEDKGFKNVECLLVSPEGEEIPVLYSGVVFDSLGITYCVDIFVDISDLTKTRLNLENTIKEKDKFFSIIAHDLRGPIGGFAASSKNFAQNMSEMSLREMQETVDTLKTSAESIYNLLENLLEWSRLQRGLAAFNVDFTSLSIIAATIVNSLAAAAQAKGVEIINKIPENTFIAADANMLSTILRNLVSNSLKFTNADGKITINFEDLNDFYRVSVRDTGIGMPQEISDNLFKLDKKVSRPGTAGESSTGLGLILCSEYVERHKGSIWAESVVGKGSTFYFTIKKNIVNQTEE